MQDLDRKNWEPMTLQHLGRMAEVVQQGGGKLSAPTGDPGEPLFKPKGQA